MPAIATSYQVDFLDAGGGTVLSIGSSATRPTNGYEIALVVPPDETRRRQTVAGPFQRGAVETASEVDEGRLRITVRCISTSWGGVLALRNTLRAAVTQEQWQCRTVIDGAADLYVGCYAADLSSPLERSLVHARHLEVTVSIPCDPTPQ